MRTTWIKELSIKRKMEYDPDFHGLIDTNLNLGLREIDISGDTLLLEITIKGQYKTKDTKEEMGTLKAIAETKITGTDFSITEEGELDFELLPENMKRVIEGAIGEDLMIYLSMATRMAHLPSLLPIPALFPREDFKEEKKKKTVPKKKS